MLGRARHGITKSRRRLEAGLQYLLLPASGYAATSATFALVARPDGQQSTGHRASVPDQLRDLQRTRSAPSNRARDSVHKWFLNRGRARVRACAVWAPAFPRPVE